MRITDLRKIVELRKKFTLRMATSAGVIVGVPIFLLMIAGGFFAALLVGLLVGGGVFALVFLLRSAVDKGVLKRTEKLGELQGDFIDVMLNREYGVLEFFDDMVVYHNCTPGSQEPKRIELPLVGTVQIGAGVIEDRKREKLIYKDTPRGQVMVKDHKNMRVYQFVFLNIDGALEHVTTVVNAIDKYQG